MHHRTDIVYQYDGSFDGFLCCVFRAVYQREDPMAIFSEDGAQATLLETALIGTEPDKAGRVLRSIPAKMGTDALRAVQWCFLSDLEDRETAILAFLRLGYRVGSPVMRMLTDPCVHKVVTAARNVANEAHLLKGFTRFSDHGGALVAEIEPKNHVLPILARHFRARMPGESFLIHDRTHKLVLLCSGGCCQILPLEELAPGRPPGAAVPAALDPVLRHGVHRVPVQPPVPHDPYAQALLGHDDRIPAGKPGLCPARSFLSFFRKIKVKWPCFRRPGRLQ